MCFCFFFSFAIWRGFVKFAACFQSFFINFVCQNIQQMLTSRSDRELNTALAETKRLEQSIAAARSQRVALEAHKNVLDDALAGKRRLV